MRDYDELVKRLREHNGWALNETLDQAADAIEELLALAQNGASAIDITNRLAQKVEELAAKDTNVPDKWISVEERLPEEGKSVLVCICSDGKYDITRGWYCKNQGFCCWDDAAMESADFITHWMPLPEPPKEDKPCQS